MNDDRFRQLLGYIDSHLDDTLSLDSLAARVAYSPFHFHRRFAALTGMGVHRYVQLSRFKRAAWQAAFRSEVSVTEMAMQSGYESIEGFSRAFRQRLGVSPAVFREQPDWARWARAWQDLDQVRRFAMPLTHDHDDVRIIEFPETAVACLSHRGAPELIGETIRRFIAWRKENHLPPSCSATWNIVYDDPEETPADAYRMDICCSCAEVAPNELGVVPATVGAGRCAVLRHTGSDAQLGDSVRFLYGEWLSESGEAPRDAPLFFKRVAFFPDVPEHEAVTEIYLPLASGT